MSNWKEKIQHGDLAEACKNTGLSRTVYYDSNITDPLKWTTSMCKINQELKRIVEERERMILEIT